MKTGLWSGIFLTVFYWNAVAAYADGFMAPKIVDVGQAADLVKSPKQEAILATDGQRVRITLRTHFQAGPKELAWIIPVPSKPTKIETGDDIVFTKLQEATAPRFVTFSGGKGGLGCGCGAAGRTYSTVGGGSVVVEERGKAGIFEYTVLSATQAVDLVKWLNKHEYLVPIGTERIAERYVQEGFYWLAMRVQPELTDSPLLVPEPICYTYANEKLIYPLEISQLSAHSSNEIVLYTLGSCRYKCANWFNYVIPESALRRVAGSPSGTNYEELVLQATEQHGRHSFVTECAWRFHWSEPLMSTVNDSSVLIPSTAEYDRPPYLTRLRALVAVSAMDCDVVLVRDQHGPNIHNTYRLSAAKYSSAAIASLGLSVMGLGLVAAGLKFSQRGGLFRPVCLSLVVVGCLLFAML